MNKKTGYETHTYKASQWLESISKENRGLIIMSQAADEALKSLWDMAGEKYDTDMLSWIGAYDNMMDTELKVIIAEHMPQKEVESYIQSRAMSIAYFLKCLTDIVPSLGKKIHEQQETYKSLMDALVGKAHEEEVTEAPDDSQ